MIDTIGILKLAAKAVGYDIIGYNEKSGLRVWNKEKTHGIKWNPLVDDGDAMRLAVSLGLSVDIHRKSPVCNVDFVEVRGYEYRKLISTVIASDNADSLGSATRQAIVNAAIHIGKSND